jgi:hypothetical protein
MKTEEREKIYKDALDFWGIEPQLRIAEEECAEFIVAASHFIRNRPGSEEVIIEEAADVYIMMEQVMRYFGQDKVLAVADQKLADVREKLKYYKDKEEENGN